MSDENQDYFSGKYLYGDDFDQHQIQAWYEDEKEGYSGIKSESGEAYSYVYHSLNRMHGFRHLNDCRFERVLGIGSAYGNEFIPIKDKIGHLTILDPSESFSLSSSLDGIPCDYRRPAVDGTLEFPDDAFDLIVCFSTLHHIPNVSYVLKECARCVSDGGSMLLREPIVSMGDWNFPRRGLTKRERGIPRLLLKKFVTNAGFTIAQENLCDFPPIGRLGQKLGVETYNNLPFTVADYLLSKVFAFNTSYHRQSLVSKIGPASIFLVLDR